jgi:cell division protein FtsW (lipid II flippase)
MSINTGEGIFLSKIRLARRDYLYFIFGVAIAPIIVGVLGTTTFSQAVLAMIVVALMFLVARIFGALFSIKCPKCGRRWFNPWIDFNFLWRNKCRKCSFVC